LSIFSEVVLGIYSPPGGSWLSRVLIVGLVGWVALFGNVGGKGFNTVNAEKMV
jgi:hypothetical protein